MYDHQGNIQTLRKMGRLSLESRQKVVILWKSGVTLREIGKG